MQQYRTRPCASGRAKTGCPWRTDTDLGDFTDADFAKLARTNATPGDEAPLGTPVMSCHQDQPDTPHPMRLCAGWLAVAGRDHLGIRMRILAGLLPPSVVEPGPGWPALYDSLGAMQARRPVHQRRAPGAD